MIFVIIHGSFGSPEGNWFPDLREKLEAFGQKVIVPVFPVDDWDKLIKAGPDKPAKNQSLDSWLAVADKLIPEITKDNKVCFIGHSLGSLFILHLVDKYNLKLDCAIFVSPFLSDLGGAWQIEKVNKAFYKDDFDWKKLQKLIPCSYVLYSDNDPYIPQKYPISFAGKLNSKKILIKSGGHLNAESGYTKFPLVEKLCKKLI